MNMRNKRLLILFTKYPTPGRAKTRLIPLLGDESAARFSKDMTEHTINTCRQLSNDVEFEVWYTDGNLEDVGEWLGTSLIIKEQSIGDLGDRMSEAIKSSLHIGCKSVIIIGSDCPGLNKDIINESFDNLESNDIVIGPCDDGGYYLIGMKERHDELFSNIKWSTDSVFENTLATARKLDLKIHILKRLKDIDRPEDYSEWNKYKK